MKDILKIVFMFTVVVLVYIYRDTISIFILDNIIYRGSNGVLSYNEYYKEEDYLYVKNMDTNTVSNYNEILSMFYSIINSGDESFSFYCDYDKCLDDINKIIDDEYIVPDINSFVHPFNSFSDINIDVNNVGKITVRIKKAYSDKQIEYIDEYINDFINKNINDSMNTRDKIKVFHDYIINNTIYDDDNKYDSYTAYTLIKNGRAICGGYSDIMAIYLNKLGIKNYKITSENHVWNLVFVDDSWLHLDLTWDDPVADDGKQYLIHNFFLITSSELLKLDKVEHTFDRNVYMEANNN